MKNPLTPAGIEPATFWTVAERLNHCANAVPDKISNIFKYTVFLCMNILCDSFVSCMILMKLFVLCIRYKIELPNRKSFRKLHVHESDWIYADCHPDRTTCSWVCRYKKCNFYCLSNLFLVICTIQWLYVKTCKANEQNVFDLLFNSSISWQLRRTCLVFLFIYLLIIWFLYLFTYFVIYLCIYLHSYFNYLFEIFTSLVNNSGLVPQMGESRGIYRVLVGKPEGKTVLETQAEMGDNIKMDL